MALMQSRVQRVHRLPELRRSKEIANLSTRHRFVSVSEQICSYLSLGLELGRDEREETADVLGREKRKQVLGRQHLTERELLCVKHQ